ncbi:MAG TPA: metalloregulator ArsR/SmtB family transcription factor [Chloroflexota bacterium]|nr:metalloregulator ArsR/SmtB family transcription factor [Chloroflexota bacterium]
MTGDDEVFRALADPSRRRLLDSLNTKAGQNLSELCAGLDMARQSVSKHLALLEAANLVTTVWRGREKLHYLNAAPINDIAERWIGSFRERAEALADLKRALEDTSVDKTAFVYTTYIKTTPERLWQALTEPAFTKRYWGGLEIETDWKPGSAITLHHGGAALIDPEQRVLEADPPRRLSYTWNKMTPEWAATWGLDADFVARLQREPRSKVTFEIEPAGGAVKLTVIHDDLEPGGLTLESISGGWPIVLSNLKSLLETGEPLPQG